MRTNKYDERCRACGDREQRSRDHAGTEVGHHVDTSADDT